MSIKLFRLIKSKASTRVTAVALFAGAIALLYGAMATPVQGLASSQRVNLGPESQSAPISITVWLKLHNEAALDAALQQMYDRNSPNYHHWFTAEQIKSQFAPTASDVAAVRNYLASYNLKVTSADDDNHFVVAEGNVGDAQRAFNTQVNRIMVNGEVRRVAASRPVASGPASALVDSVQGLSDINYRTNVKRSADPDTGTPFAGMSPSSPSPNGLFFSSDCLRGVQTVTFTTNGGLPKATYTGNRYGADITNQNPPNLPPCGYDANEMQKAYGLKPLFQSGLDGTGQTIVIVDAFGSNTIVEDANLFSKLNNLPPLTPANFQIVKPQHHATCNNKNGCIAGNWQFETSIDVEWAHAMAPNAKIVLVLSKDNSDHNLNAANLFAIEHHLGNVISNSFGSPEISLVDLAPSQLGAENRIARLAAAAGISQNVSSGDSGDDLLLDLNFFGINATSVDSPASSPFVTAIGGTSTFLNNQNEIQLQTGWGNNLTRIADVKPNPPQIPLLFLGFQGGAGGGTSVVYPKPNYQNLLGGNHRKLPDISMNADPFTGNEIIVTPDSVPGHPQTVEVFGGTSLSTPMFSAVWAIANQANGGNSLGLAAPLLYQLSGNAIIDVNVPGSATQNNVTGTIIKPNNTQHLSADALATPQEPTNQYLSALYHSPFSTRWFVITFGTDSSLATTPGWDNVTGLGTPNGANFINAVVAAAK